MASNLERKRAAMVCGEKINCTENRSVMHMALRSPREKEFFVDGENVVPQVHEVLDKVGDELKHSPRLSIM